jgi:membrane associated rhomboid family serine protease
MIPINDENPAHITPVVTIVLIAACLAIFFWQANHSPEDFQKLVYQYGMIPALLFTDAKLEPELVVVPPVMTIFTSMFLHGSWMHLLGNLLYLWIFGNNIEDATGHSRFIVFYFVCGLIAALAQSLADPSAEIPMVGASGAISGVLGAYIVLFPGAQVLVFIPLGFFSHLRRLPALWVLGFWFALQILSSFATDPRQGGVAFLAHAGGFIAGMALIRFFRDPNVLRQRGPRIPY